MKMSFVTTGLQIGGAETMVCEVAIGMRARGHEAEVISLIEPQAYLDRFAAAGVPVTSLGLRRHQKDLLSILKAATAFRTHVRRQGPDLVHANMVHANIFSRLALAGSGIPLICTVHSTFEGGVARDLAYRLTNWASTLNTTVSAAATARATETGTLPSTTLTVPNGVRSERFSPAELRKEPRPFRWITVGRLEPAKDIHTLLRALAQINDAELRIVGDGSERRHLEQYAVELGVSGRAFFLGARDDVPQLLQAGDGFVMSSRWEGFGLALVEAMLSGLPVVATDSGGPSEIVGRDQTCGFIVPPHDADALAGAMATVAALPFNERAQVARRGGARARELYDLERVLDRWESIYSGLVRTHGLFART